MYCEFCGYHCTGLFCSDACEKDYYKDNPQGFNPDDVNNVEVIEDE